MKYLVLENLCTCDATITDRDFLNTFQGYRVIGEFATFEEAQKSRVYMDAMAYANQSYDEMQERKRRESERIWSAPKGQ